jgi:putative CocE/NonD family hydrolase
MRTPYDKGVAEFESLLHPEWYARQGFILVTQDVRGCFAPDGAFEPLAHGFDDGVDTIEQCAALAKSNGAVGMHGFSYSGTTQLLPATRGPQALKAIAPAFTNGGVYEDWCYKNGAFQQCLSQVWAAGLAIGEAFRCGEPADWRPALKAFDGLPGEYGHLPLTDHPSLSRDFVPLYYEWLEHSTFDDYWKRWHLGERCADITIPALHLVGWYDLFIEGTICNYQGLVTMGSSALARGNQKLAIGPWHHRHPANLEPAP